MREEGGKEGGRERRLEGVHVFLHERFLCMCLESKPQTQSHSENRIQSIGMRIKHKNDIFVDYIFLYCQ